MNLWPPRFGYAGPLNRRIETKSADAIAVEQRRNTDLTAGRRDIPQRSPVRAVGVDGGYIWLVSCRCYLDG